MSGRVRHTLPNGRRVIGFRKTLVERGPRSPAHLMPDWTLSFLLPEGHSLPPHYHHGIIGLTVEPIGWEQQIKIAGKSKTWVIDQAVAFMRRIGLPKVRVLLTRPAEVGPTISGPLRRTQDEVRELVVTPYRAWASGNGQMRLLA